MTATPEARLARAINVKYQADYTTRQLIEWLEAPDNAEMLDAFRRILALERGPDDLSFAAHLRVRTLECLAPIPWKSGPKLGLFTILATSALHTIDWEYVAGCISRGGDNQ